MNKTSYLLLTTCMAFSALNISGCSIDQTYNKQYYVIEVKRPAVNQPDEQNKKILEVVRFSIDSAFNTRELICRTGESLYEPDFYNCFLASPESMIAEKTRCWLSDSGIFKFVLDRTSRIQPTHLLEGNITAIYCDCRDEKSPIAVMELKIFLSEINSNPDPNIVFSKTYRSNIPLQTGENQILVQTLNVCLAEILTTMEKDLAENCK